MGLNQNGWDSSPKAQPLTDNVYTQQFDGGDRQWCRPTLEVSVRVKSPPEAAGIALVAEDLRGENK